jgi:hypothetical protein
MSLSTSLTKEETRCSVEGGPVVATIALSNGEVRVGGRPDLPLFKASSEIEITGCLWKIRHRFHSYVEAKRRIGKHASRSLAVGGSSALRTIPCARSVPGPSGSRKNAPPLVRHGQILSGVIGTCWFEPKYAIRGNGSSVDLCLDRECPERLRVDGIAIGNPDDHVGRPCRYRYRDNHHRYHHSHPSTVTRLHSTSSRPATGAEVGKPPTIRPASNPERCIEASP